MPAAAISPAEWQALKVASIRGVSDAELAAEYGVTEGAIRVRRARDPVWGAVFTPQKQQMKREDVNATRLQQVVTKSIAEKGENCRNRLLDLAKTGIEKAISADLPVESWQDAKIVAEIASKAAGWAGETGPQVQVLFTGGTNTPTLDADCEVVREEPGSDAELL
jgi:hypothetical protein